MDPSYDKIPEEFVDPIACEFAYDPIRLPVTEDPAQVIYNRRTLEKIWDDKHDAVNPYTRQPFDIHHAIPQTELRQQMQRYIVENSTNCLEVISEDYTKPLNSTDMKHLLNDLVIAADHCRPATDNSNEEKPETSWKVLWQKLNLLRLYCQYSAENRETFLSVKEHEFLMNVITPMLGSVSLYPSIEDNTESCKEVAKIVDIVDLQVPPEENVLSFIQILSDLLKCQLLKIETIVLRICRRLYQCFDCNRKLRLMFSNFSFNTALYLLDHRRNSKEITNENLYNGTAILKFDWVRKNCCGLESYVDALVNVVIICISRFQDLHAAATRRDQAQAQAQAQAQSQAQAQAQAEASFIISRQDDHEDEEEQKNIDLISSALDQALFIIDSIVWHDEVVNEPRESMWKILEYRLQRLDIVKDILKMVELVVAGVKFFQSSHLGFGLNITAILCQEHKVSVITKRNVVKVCGDFLGSDIVDEYDTQVKHSLEDILLIASLHSSVMWH